MFGMELVVGYLVAWAVRKARRVGERLDEDTDLVIDTGLDRLHDLVAAKLGADPALERLSQEAAESDEVSDRTRRRVEDALAEAADGDEEFATELAALVAELQQSRQESGAVAHGERSAAVHGNVRVSAEGGSAAAVTMGDVTLGAPPARPPTPGQPGG